MNHLSRFTELTLKFLRFFFLCMAPSAVFAIDDGTYYLDATFDVVNSVTSGVPSSTTTVTVSGSMTVINVGGVPTIPDYDVTMSANGQTVSMIPAAASAAYFRFKTATQGAGLIDLDRAKFGGGIENIDGIWFSTNIVAPAAGIGFCEVAAATAIADWDVCLNVYTSYDANAITFTQAPLLTLSGKTVTISGQSDQSPIIYDGSSDITAKFVINETAAGIYEAVAKDDLFSGESLNLTTKMNGVGLSSFSVTGSIDSTAPTVSLTGPTGHGTSDFTVTITFSEAVSGFAADDITVVNGTKGTFTEVTAGTVYTLVISPAPGSTVSVKLAGGVLQDAAGNSNAESDTLEIQSGTPATEFEAKKEDIKTEIVSDVKANLQNVLSANVNLVKQAKVRFIASQSNTADAMNFLPGRNSVPLNYDASLSADSARITSRGNFFAQQGSYDGKSRQVVFGDFSVVGEKDGSVTGTLSSRIARERHISDQTMMGYFLGVEISHTDIYSSFSGKNRGYGLIMGGYFVNELTDNMFVDGFVSVGTGNNILDMSNDVLSLEGIYQTRSGSIGGALTGVYDMGTYEFWPELSFAVGKTKTLKANFTGTAYGLVDDSLTLDIGDTTIAKLTVRPEMRRDLEDEYMSSGYTSQLTMAPRLICEWVTTDRRTQDCGSGAEVGLLRRSYDGLSQFTGTISRDYVGSSGRTGLEFKFERRF